MSSLPVFRRAFVAAALTSALFSSASFAAEQDSVADFYKRNTVQIIVSTAAGGGVDAYSRLLGRHLAEHIPGKPNLVVQNMPGAAGIKAANWLYNQAPKDGTVIGHVQRGTLIEPLFGNPELKFDASKVDWLGSLNTEWSVTVAGAKSGLTSLEDARQREYPLAAEGPTASDYIYAAVLNNVIGTKFKIVSGYSGKPEEMLAIERGEVAGLSGWAWSSAKALAGQQIDSGQFKVIAFLAPEKRPGFEHVPTVYDYVKNEDDRQLLDFIFGPQVLGRPHFTPKGAPAERLAALRKAHDDTVKDPAFLADADKAKLDLDPIGGAELQKRIEAIYATPPAVVERSKSAREYRGVAKERASNAPIITR
jgi:tripartite-type tricarboxylate transporter receptor subunit TctC